MIMKEGALLEHLEELRFRLLFVIVYFLIFFGVGIIISPVIIKKVIGDLIITTVKLVALSPIELIYAQIKVGFVFSLILSVPVVIYQLIRFIKPGLNKKEINAVKYATPSMILLFILGMLFGYFVFLKISLNFLARLSSFADIQNMWSIDRFISFIIWVCFGLGLVFETPLVLILLNKLGIITKGVLKKYRAHIYVLIFIIGAMITPPDIVTQILIALPLVVLFEISYWLIV
jgi:sec-independent protein translocase protein TatC